MCLYCYLDVYIVFFYDEEIINNNEFFWSLMWDLDLVVVVEEVGFFRDSFIEMLLVKNNGM